MERLGRLVSCEGPDVEEPVKILVLTQYYPPEGAHIPATIAEGLAERGHSVRVVTGFPNYPAGRIYPGFTQRWRDRKRVGSLDVLRVPLWIDHSENPLKRVLNYSSFAVSAATTRRFAKGADVIYVYATQMTPALGPWLWRLRGGAPYVLHIQDLWPDSITGSSLVSARAARLIERLLTPWLRSVYRRASAVIGIAPTMVETLRSRGVDLGRAHLVYNWAAEDGSVEDLKDRFSLPGKGARILYGGNVGDLQDLETAIHAAHNARDAGVRLTIIGDGVALFRIRALAEELRVTNVDFLGRVPPADMASFYAASDYALVTLKDLPAFRGTIPSKLQASLAHGLPIISNVQGDVRRLVEGAGIGFTADAESAASLEDAFRRAADATAAQRSEMVERASAQYQGRFSKAAGLIEVEGILRRCATEQRSDRVHTKGAPGAGA